MYILSFAKVQKYNDPYPSQYGGYYPFESGDDGYSPIIEEEKIML